MAPKNQEKGLIEKLSGYLTNPFKSGPPPKTPASLGDRLSNIAVNNFRGLIGSIVAIIVVCLLWVKTDNPRKLEVMWFWMFWFYLFQPVAVPNTSLIPVFYLPMCGVLNSAATCKCFMNETIMLFILSSWLVVLLNNSGVDKRIALWFLASGDTSQYSGEKLVFKTGSAAFFLSLVSSRLMATLNLTELVTKACQKADPSGKISDVRNIRYAVNNAIQTSSSIGSMGILHGSYVTLLFRGCFNEFVKKSTQWPDIFNYFTYSVFAFPVAFIMFIVNIIYHTVLVGKVSKGLSEPQKKEIKTALERNKAEIPKDLSLHEMYSVLFLIIMVAVFFFRWIPMMDLGWGKFSESTKAVLGCQDATAAALFVIALHVVPKTFDFLKVFSAQKKSQLNMKPESGILWWRFIDKNCNYGYLYTFGAAFSLLVASKVVGMDREFSQSFPSLANMDFNLGILLAVVGAVILSNVMTSMAACSVWLPFILCLSVEGAWPWPKKVYLAALGVGMGCNLGFCTPFQYTPAYYCHHTGKVPIRTMIKYSIVPVVICTIMLFVSVAFVGELILDKDKEGFSPIQLPTTTKATKATTEAPPPGLI